MTVCLGNSTSTSSQTQAVHRRYHYQTCVASPLQLASTEKQRHVTFGVGFGTRLQPRDFLGGRLFQPATTENKFPKCGMWSSYDLPCRVAKHAEGVPAALRTKLGWPLSNCMPAISTRRLHTGPCSPLGMPRPSRAGCRRRRCAVSTILAPQRRKGEQKNRP
jgi:hypothetical protein